jgi:hypothetical protein
VLKVSSNVNECKPLVGGGLVCLACAFATVASTSVASTRKTAPIAPWALEAVKAVTVTVVIGCVVIADTVSGVSGPGHEHPALFVARPLR